MQGTTRWGKHRRTVALVAALVVAGVLAACAPPPSDPGSPPTTVDPLPAPPAEFTTLAYNVAGLPQEISRANPREHIPLISPLLNEYDVVLTQEDFDWWTPLAGLLDFRNYHARLRADATHPFRTNVHPGPAAVGVSPQARPLLVGDGIGIMSRFPLTGESHHAWSKCNGDAFFGAADCLAMKGFRVVTMTLGDGRLVDVYSLHAEAGSGDRDQQLQELNYREMADVILARGDDRAIIVGGDTNLHIVDGRNEPNTGEVDRVIWHRFLAETGLTDVCVEVSCAEPENIDKFAYRSSSTVDLTPIEMTFPRERFTSPAGRELSDHAPVVVRWSWDLPAG
jgi:hypothetical protein